LKPFAIVDRLEEIIGDVDGDTKVNEGGYCFAIDIGIDSDCEVGNLRRFIGPVITASFVLAAVEVCRQVVFDLSVLVGQTFLLVVG